MIPKKVSVLKVSDITLPKDHGQGLLKYGISQSMLSIFLTCRQKFLFKINFWELDRDNKNVMFGNVFHDLLDKAYHETTQPNLNGIGKWIDEYLDANEEQFAQTKPEEINKITALTHLMLKEYIFYHAEDWVSKKFTGIEQKLNVTFQGFNLTMKIDGYYEQGNEHWNMEHKTKSQIDEDFLLLSLSFDLQNLFYIIGREIAQKIKVKGTLYNIIRTPMLHERKGEGPELYAKRVAEAIKKDPDHYFKRYEVFYTEEDKKRFSEELFFKLSELKQVLEGKLPIYRNETSCHKPCKCEFLEACASGTMVGYRVRGRKR